MYSPKMHQYLSAKNVHVLFKYIGNIIIVVYLFMVPLIYTNCLQELSLVFASWKWTKYNLFMYQVTCWNIDQL